ncbi:hypothetical protein M0R04_10980 [Candidatus Dojkabacteria bacterium]|jgi:hypothetical protein|nr:hypothetical protein [Candidatus Dojkabacteria bacterium]
MAKTLLTDNTNLTNDKQYTFLSQDVVATGSTIRVQSIIGFESLTTSSGQILCIGKIGDEKTEIRRTSNTTALSTTYNQVTLRDTLQFNHPQDTPVYIIDWDRVEIQHATTVSGSKSTIVTYPYNITPDQENTIIKDSSKTSGYYFTRFNETIGNTSSNWSDAIPYGGFDANSVAKIKERALNSLGEEVDGKLITHELLDEWLWEARRQYHEAPGKRPFRRKYNTAIGSVVTGSFRIDLPTDVERPYSAENVFGVRIGTEDNMNFYDKKEYDFDYRNKPHSTLDVPYTVNTSTSIWLANGRDFSDSAVISVEGTNIGLSRVTGETGSFYVYSHGDWSASAGSDAFQNIDAGLPDKFTVWANPEGSAYIYFNRPFSTTYVNQNIWCDYYRTLVGYNSDGDILDEPDYDMYIYFLKAKIKDRKSKGEFDITKDSDFQQWILYKDMALKKEYAGVELRMFPDIEHLP